MILFCMFCVPTVKTNKIIFVFFLIHEFIIFDIPCISLHVTFTVHRAVVGQQRLLTVGPVVTRAQLNISAITE